MSAYMVFGDAAIGVSSARVAREDVTVLRDAGSLYEQAKKARDAAETEAANAKDAGYEAGKLEALGEMHNALTQALSHLTEQFALENARREAEVANAAMTAVEQLIGSVPEVDRVRGLARQALRHLGANAGNVRLHVAPEWAAQLTDTLDQEGVTEVAADPSLDGFACRVTSGEGRIIADLDTQLVTLRERWGIGEHADARSDANG